MDGIEINLNSKYAKQFINNSNSNCIFDIGYIDVPPQTHLHMKFKNCIFPHSFYNINSSNNYIIFVANGLTYTYIMDYGNYNAIQIVKWFNTNVANMTCSYNPITNRFTFIHSFYEFAFTNASSSLELFGIAYYHKYSTDKKLVSEFCINLNPIQSIFIQSNFNTGNIISLNPNLKNVIGIVPVNTHPNSLITYENINMNNSNLYVNNLNSVSLRITDQNNNIIDFNGLDWSVNLVIEVIDFAN